MSYKLLWCWTALILQYILFVLFTMIAKHDSNLVYIIFIVFGWITKCYFHWKPSNKNFNCFLLLKTQNKNNNKQEVNFLFCPPTPE